MIIKEIHLAGVFSIKEILESNQVHSSNTPFESFFPFWQILPGVETRLAGESPAGKETMLVVINLNDKVWNQIKDGFSSYGRKILLQTEAYINYEAAYRYADKFDVFINFDPTYSPLPGFYQAFVPYYPYRPNSKRDLRGLNALKKQWTYSRSVFLDAYLLRFFPRHRKACFIITLHAQEHYQIRLRVARKWTNEVDVYGGAWPADLPSWKGMCADKIAVARRYQYALVMENQRQPGYVTEKLLDAVAAGCVPIYWGAPDVSRLPGSEAFIPFEDEDFPVGQVIKVADRYLERRKILLANRRALFDVFSVDNYISTLKKALNG
jgi:hypothetical protein